MGQKSAAHFFAWHPFGLVLSDGSILYDFFPFLIAYLIFFHCLFIISFSAFYATSIFQTSSNEKYLFYLVFILHHQGTAYISMRIIFFTVQGVVNKMIYSLDLPLYKNGYTIQEFNCIDTPICAACSYYNNDNYFLIGFLLAIKYNWENNEFDISYRSANEIMKEYTDLLHMMGIQLHSEDVNNKEQLLTVIHEKIKNKNPVLLLTKYKHLYYSPYFMDDEGDRYHLLVIDKYNSKTGIITVRDSAALNGINLLNDEISVLFPIAMKENDICEIWQNTKSENDNIYFLEKINDGMGVENVLNTWKNVIKHGNNSFSYFAKKIINYKEVLSTEYSYFYKRFIGCISGIFKIIRYFCDKENFDFEEHFSILKKEYIERRCKFLNVLTKFAVSGIMPDTVKLNKMSDEIIELDKHYLNEILKKCSELFCRKEVYDYTPLNIEIKFNNKAFESNAGIEPNISGNGIYFVIPQAEIESRINKNKTFFKLGDFTNTVGYDNISCTGQSISIGSQHCKRLSILACSEYGSYEEELCLKKNGVEIEKIKFTVSDFYMNPIYNEEIFCSGQTFQHFAGGTKQLDFTSKIFEYRLYPKNEEFDEIVLPKRRNIHIFAITLCN